MIPSPAPPLERISPIQIRPPVAIPSARRKLWIGLVAVALVVVVGAAVLVARWPRRGTGVAGNGGSPPVRSSDRPAAEPRANTPTDAQNETTLAGQSGAPAVTGNLGSQPVVGVPTFTPAQRNAIRLLGPYKDGVLSFPVDFGDGSPAALARADQATKRNQRAGDAFYAVMRSSAIVDHLEERLRLIAQEGIPDFYVVVFGDQRPPIGAIVATLGKEQAQVSGEYLAELAWPMPGFPEQHIQNDDSVNNTNYRIKPLTWYSYGRLEFAVVEGTVRAVKVTCGHRQSPGSRR